MRLTVLSFLLMSITLGACNTASQDAAGNAPAINIQVLHFDSVFFAMDTLNFEASLATLVKTYPEFSADYFNRILMRTPSKEGKSILAFYKAYLPVYQATKKVNASKIATPEIAAALKRFHFFFPKYILPNQLIYFIGPLETYGNVVTKDGIGIGLQLYLGAQSSWYYSEQINTIYPTYISRQFAPEYIVVNSIQNILNDYEPIALNGKQLIEQMIEIGKRQYILQQCLPNSSDTLLFGYTSNQLKAIESNQEAIWLFISSQNRLFSVDPNLTNALLTEAPYNDYFGEDIPGNVGKFIGHSIVKAWMQQQSGKSKTDLDQLLKIPSIRIFNEAKLNF